MKNVKVDQTVVVEMAVFHIVGRVTSVDEVTMTVLDQATGREEILWAHHILNVEIM